MEPGQDAAQRVAPDRAVGARNCRASEEVGSRSSGSCGRTPRLETSPPPAKIVESSGLRIEPGAGRNRSSTTKNRPTILSPRFVSGAHASHNISYLTSSSLEPRPTQLATNLPRPALEASTVSSRPTFGHRRQHTLKVRRQAHTHPRSTPQPPK